MLLNIKQACKSGPFSASHRWKWRPKREKTDPNPGVLKGRSQQASLSRDAAPQDDWGEWGVVLGRGRRPWCASLSACSHFPSSLGSPSPPAACANPSTDPSVLGLKGSQLGFPLPFLAFGFLPYQSGETKGQITGCRHKGNSPQSRLGWL